MLARSLLISLLLCMPMSGVVADENGPSIAVDAEIGAPDEGGPVLEKAKGAGAVAKEVSGTVAWPPDDIDKGPPDPVFKTSSPLEGYRKAASALIVGCKSPEYGPDRTPFAIAVIDLDVFFVIPGRPAEWLPPRPNKQLARQTIDGLDKDKDCVRDDIEYYIAGRFNNGDDRRVRKYLFQYARWLGKFLIPNISVNTARSVATELYKSAECVRRILGPSVFTTQLLDDVFAQFHDTVPRSRRYISNSSRLGGWTTRDNIPVSCP